MSSERVLSRSGFSVSQVAERHERIARAVKTQPSRPLYKIANDFGVGLSTVRRACERFDIVTSGRPVRKWGEASISEGTWLHVGDILMEIGRDNRSTEILQVEYHDDLTVSYRCKALGDFRKGKVTRIHERTIKRQYVRIQTEERVLPEERFMAWTFGISN